MPEQQRWICTKCGRSQGEPATKLLDATYGTQKCLTCMERRIFHLEVTNDSQAQDRDRGTRRA